MGDGVTGVALGNRLKCVQARTLGGQAPLRGIHPKQHGHLGGLLTNALWVEFLSA
jgi:hypothetical protein